MADMHSTYFPKNLFTLEGRIALVTGGGTGIGLMITHGFAAAGAKVYVTGRRLSVLERVASEWNQLGKGGKIIPLQMDVTNKESILAGKKVIEEKEGKLHVLVNNAGQVGPVSQFMEQPDAPELKNAESLGMGLFNESLEGWADLYAINTFSIFFVTNAFLGLLTKGSEDVKDYWSSIINITSISGHIKLAQNHFCYNSAKAASSHLSKIMASEFHLKKIPVRINTIAPGVYASEMTVDKFTKEQVDMVGKGISPVPMERDGTGEEMAGTALYLASRAGGYTTGQDIIIDGGYVAVNPAVH
ncbi:Rhamnolipids biosynthesis 3-oxoacyl-[acyl-carrier-protein] reductase [Leucoagaricus sp. SymC.cos]|nr:Rhamnolipids biosynthesis 3-oxoacyl-[acyl-carrier-protein] reductase [Leucoagaricus sp. SymC.cos]